MDELKRFDVPAADILNAKYSDNFTALMKFQTERAEKYYAQAIAQLPDVDRRSQRPGLIMAAIYRTLLDEIRRDEFPGPAPAHRADPGAQALDRLENLGLRMKVAVIGGGWAGIAAAVELTAAGIANHAVRSRPRARRPRPFNQ
jgi:hypothetical protein